MSDTDGKDLSRDCQHRRCPCLTRVSEILPAKKAAEDQPMTSHPRPKGRVWGEKGLICDKELAGDQNPEPQSLEDKGFRFCLWG